MTPPDDDLLTALSSARPDPEYRPSPHSPEATAMLAGILDGRPEPARRRVTRRRLALAALPALAVGVAAALVAVFVTPSGSAPARLSAATVRTAILDALQQDSGDILYVNMSDPAPVGNGSVTRIGWVYPAFPAVGQQVRFREFQYNDGKPDQDVESSYTETADMEQPTLSTTGGPRSAKIFAVYYPSRIWSSFTTSTIPVALNDSPALIRSEIASGHFTIDGTVKLNGREAVKVSWADKYGPFTNHVTLWVDARTYVLLREASVEPMRPGQPVWTSTVTYQMRPATPASLKELTPVIPAGFTHATQIPGFDRIGN